MKMIRGFLLAAAGWSAVAVAGDPPAPQLRYGELMSEVGHRFETMGRAVKARRYGLAAFELDELGEVFEEDLPHAERPKVPTEVNLEGLAEAFRQTHPPELNAAIKAHNQAAFAKAFARAAETCNGCHKTTGHQYIEVPSTPGSAVPKMDPLPDTPAPKAPAPPK
jgi:cytochrome c556